MSAIPRRERVAFVAVSAIAFLYVLSRALCVPPIHDEARIFRICIQNGAPWELHARWDAGNHLLVTFVGLAVSRITGDAMWGLRLFPILSYCLYAWGAWSVAQWVRSARVRVSLWMALLCTPFLIEFFSLFRGYGPALAFELIGTAWLVRHAATGSVRALIAALVLMALAAFASLMFFLVFAATVLMVCIRSLLGPTSFRDLVPRVAAIIVFGALPLFLFTVQGMNLADHDPLTFGGHSGFVIDTAGSLARWILGIEHPFLAMGSCIIGAALILRALLLLRHEQQGMEEVRYLVIATLLAVEVSGRVIMDRWMHVPFPMDRRALQLVPLFLILAALAIDRLAVRRPMIAWSALLLLALPLRAIATANWDHTSYWIEQAIPQDVFDRVALYEAKIPRPLILGGNYPLSECWNYGRERRGEPPLPLDMEVFPQLACDVMIIDTTQFTAPIGMRTLYTAPSGHLVIKEPIVPIALTALFDTLIPVPNGDQEFVPLWSPPVTSAMMHASHALEIDALIDAGKRSSELELIVEIDNAKGEHPYYDRVELGHLRRQWDHRRLRVIRRVPALGAGAARVAVYFYNPDRKSIAFPRIRMRAYTIGSGERP